MLIFLDSINDDAQRKRFEWLYDRFKDPMMRMAQSILHNHHDAEDAVHDVFLRIATRHIKILDSLSDEQDLKYYLLASVKNTAINIARRNRKHLPLDDNINEHSAPGDDDFLDMLCSHLEYEELVRMIQSMPSPYKEVLYYRFYLELKVSAISRLTNRPVSTIKKQLSRGKKILLNQLTGDKE